MKSDKKRKKKALRIAKIKAKRTFVRKDSIQAIWSAFLKTEEKDFKEAFKYGKDEIEKIGIQKFLTAIGFSSVKDVSKWRTDAMHLVICPDCGNDFGIYEYYSVCPSCEKQYNMEKVHKMHSNMMKENKNEANPGEFLFAFSLSKELRNFCKINSDDNSFVPIYALRYNDNTQEFEVSLLEDLTTGDKAKLVLSNGEFYEEDGCTTFVIKSISKVEDVEEKDGYLALDIEPFKRVVPINAFSD